MSYESLQSTVPNTDLVYHFLIPKNYLEYSSTFGVTLQKKTAHSMVSKKCQGSQHATPLKMEVDSTNISAWMHPVYLLKGW